MGIEVGEIRKIVRWPLNELFRYEILYEVLRIEKHKWWKPWESDKVVAIALGKERVFGEFLINEHENWRDRLATEEEKLLWVLGHEQ